MTFEEEDDEDINERAVRGEPDRVSKSLDIYVISLMNLWLKLYSEARQMKMVITVFDSED
jgi:hypothetical protein